MQSSYLKHLQGWALKWENEHNHQIFQKPSQVNLLLNGYFFVKD